MKAMPRALLRGRAFVAGRRASPDGPKRPLTDRSRRRRLFAVLLVGVASTNFPMSVFGASLPLVARDLGTDEATITWVVTAPLLALAISLPVFGRIGDVYGHRHVYLWGLGVGTALAIATAASWDAMSLIGIRTLGQTAGAATQPASMALLLSSFSKHERAKVIGWWSLVTAGSPTLGLVFGGPLIDATGWRTLFIVQSVPGALIFFVALRLLRDTTPKKVVAFDIPGAATFGIAIFGALFGLNRSVAWGVDHTAVRVSIIASVVFLALFVIIERRARQPLLPLSFFTRRNYVAPMVAIVFMSSAYWGGFVLVPFLLAGSFGYTSVHITAIMIARTVSFMAFAALAGYTSTWIGEKATAAVGAVMVAASFLTLSAGAASTSVTYILLGQVLVGGGFGLSRPPYTASIANSVDESDLGIASASQIIADRIGAASGITIITALHGGGNDPASFVYAFNVAAAISVAPIALSLFVRRSRRPPDTPEAIVDT